MGHSSVVEHSPYKDNALTVLQPSVSLTKREIKRKTAVPRTRGLLPVGLFFGSTYPLDLQYWSCPIKGENSCKRRSICHFMRTNHSVLTVVFWASSRALVPEFDFELQAQANWERTCEYWCWKNTGGEPLESRLLMDLVGDRSKTEHEEVSPNSGPLQFSI